MKRNKPYLYQNYTWAELKNLVPRQPVVILPIGSVEDHGLHLPLDVDNFLIWEICEAAGRKAPDDILPLPIIPYGFEEHHMDFPGTINVGMEHLLHFVVDITRSVAHHGFEHILIADGHGSNMPILELAARRTILETKASCAAFIWPALAADVINSLRQSEKPGGMSHACELETSVYLLPFPPLTLPAWGSNISVQRLRKSSARRTKLGCTTRGRFRFASRSAAIKGGYVVARRHGPRLSSEPFVTDPGTVNIFATISCEDLVDVKQSLRIENILEERHEKLHSNDV